MACAVTADLTEKELSTSFDFSGDEKRKKGTHWKRDKNLRDVLNRKLYRQTTNPV